MRTFKALTKVGNSLAIIVPKEWIDHLAAKEKDIIDFEVHNVPQDFIQEEEQWKKKK